MRRPTTSAASARPSTASTSNDPSSWDPASIQDPQFYPAQYQSGALYAQEELTEEDDESEDEDVFAYGPPVTGHIAPATPVSATETTALAHQPESPPLSSLTPTFGDPEHRTVSLQRIAEALEEPPPDFKAALRPVDETPPPTNSTDLHDPEAAPGESFRMSRLSSAPVSLPVSRNLDSREVHVSLPSRGDTGLSDALTGNSDFPRLKRSPSQDTGSIMDVDPELDGSLKMDLDIPEEDPDEDSPYPEVRASVSNIDDPSMPALTFRMWVIGIILCVLASGMNVFFNFRQPAPSVIALVLLLISHPIGKLAAYALPIRTWRLPRRLGGYEFSLNPGPFNVKEHVLIFIMANVSISSPYAMQAIVVSEVYYDYKLSFWFSLLLILATQLTGFGLAGMCRRFLVWPASMIWPQNLVACTLVNTLHAEDDDMQGGISRYKFFMIAFTCAMFYFFLPGYLFTALSSFSWLCWVAPNNVVVNQVFGTVSGLGAGLLTFDWAQISWIGSPLMVPWWAEVHVFAGFVLFYWILLPILYYTNVWDLAYFPLFSLLPYDRFGNTYDIPRILNTDHTLNQTKYEEYSTLFLPAGYVVTYLLAFAISTCVIVHTILYHGRALLNGFKRMKIEKDDIHAKLMRNYPEVPDWWYLLFFVFFFALAIIAVERWHTQVPIWALVLALALPVVYIIPGGFIFAMTGQIVTLNLLAQILPGTLLPGNPFANMVFKSYAIQTYQEAMDFVQDLKLGHYIKVPPRATFMVQSCATVIAAFVQVATKEWLFANVPNMCSPSQPDHLTCPHNTVFYTASAVWGLIGPTRQFGNGALYHPELYALIIGALIPFPFWLWQKRFPRSRLKYISMPIIINGVWQIPPATGINYSAWFIVAFIFQYVVRRTRFAWWSKFNYVLSAALDSGTVIGILLVFFTLQLPKGIQQPSWWGNNVYKNTTDYNKLPFLAVPEGGIPS